MVQNWKQNWHNFICYLIKGIKITKKKKTFCNYCDEIWLLIKDYENKIGGSYIILGEIRNSIEIFRKIIELNKAENDNKVALG